MKKISISNVKKIKNKITVYSDTVIYHSLDRPADRRRRESVKKGINNLKVDSFTQKLLFIIIEHNQNSLFLNWLLRESKGKIEEKQQHNY